ncbi:putative phage protein [Escherichia coli]|uniref:DUF551 domain-containing protein n=1 Tax=Escherichia coli TaxID=562 RepID=UPI0010CBDA5F|nr:DUF551 domain-containing protein [Escherichia coli]EHY1686852.1 DUF551 domain-containing protein [Escherichia coli]EME9932062.1 DUF551 domain-containing protein [Escherichia coli]GDL78926.1 putative phage protein [Escherichia coli]
MTTITKDRLLTIQHWRETYGPGSNVVLPAEEAEELARIALASLAAVSDERAAYELFMEKRFGESVDRRRAKNGDREYMAWDMALGWIIWCHRAAMLQAGNFRENKNSSTNNFREISETSTNSPVTPDGWISCSERMPAQDDWILIYSKHGEYMAGQVQGEYVELSYGTLSWLGNALYWMPLPEPPQEAK